MGKEKKGYKRCVKCKQLSPDYYEFVDSKCFHCRFKEKHPHHMDKLYKLWDNKKEKRNAI